MVTHLLRAAPSKRALQSLRFELSFSGISSDELPLGKAVAGRLQLQESFFLRVVVFGFGPALFCPLPVNGGGSFSAQLGPKRARPLLATEISVSPPRPRPTTLVGCRSSPGGPPRPSPTPPSTRLQGALDARQLFFRPPPASSLALQRSFSSDQRPKVGRREETARALSFAKGGRHFLSEWKRSPSSPTAAASLGEVGQWYFALPAKALPGRIRRRRRRGYRRDRNN